MLTFTDIAKQRVVEFMEKSDQDFSGLRLVANKQGRTRFRYEFSLVTDDQTYEEDSIIDLEQFTSESRNKGRGIKRFDDTRVP